jgi:hypothetical protein
LHFQLHVITRLSFNEQGRITHHRDFWDIKDVMGMVPGLRLFNWISCRVAAQGLSLATRLLGGVDRAVGFGHSRFQTDGSDSDTGLDSRGTVGSDWGRRGMVVSAGKTPAGVAGAGDDALGLEL